MPVSAYPPGRLLAAPLGPRGARRDRRMRLGPGPLLTLRVHAPPDAFDLTHTSVTGRSPAGKSRTHVGRRSCNRPNAPHTGHHPVAGVARWRAPAHHRVGYRQHGHAFQPKHHRGTTVVVHLGPFHSCPVTPRIMRPQGRFQGQPINHVDQALPCFITKPTNQSALLRNRCGTGSATTKIVLSCSPKRPTSASPATRRSIALGRIRFAGRTTVITTRGTSRRRD